MLGNDPFVVAAVVAEKRLVPVMEGVYRAVGRAVGIPKLIGAFLKQTGDVVFAAHALFAAQPKEIEHTHAFFIERGHRRKAAPELVRAAEHKLAEGADGVLCGIIGNFHFALSSVSFRIKESG